MLLLLINPVFAYEVGRINYRLTGTVIVYTCGINISTADKYVDLGTWAATQIVFYGHGYTSFVPFNFQLTDCPPNAKVFFTFRGTKDSTDSELLALKQTANSAQNVAIEIANDKGERIPVGTRYFTTQVDDQGNGEAKFQARYRATKANPTAGEANADATFVITYD